MIFCPKPKNLHEDFVNVIDWFKFTLKYTESFEKNKNSI